MKAYKILLGISGGIAAYKSADLCRRLVKQGFQVRVVMTKSATEFITPLSFQALSGFPVHTELLDADAEAGMGHIELAKWPDLVLVAPATASLIARYEQGLATDLLSTILIATIAPVAIAPAMNQAMWAHPTTQRNFASLSELMTERLSLWGPAEGQQACGDVGPGRVLEPEELCQKVINFFEPAQAECEGSNFLKGKRIVITAGPTREAIDPVRFVSNHSSGKMGYAIAGESMRCGADVVLVSGPVSLPAIPGVTMVSVRSAQDMLESVEEYVSEGCDIFIASAAVADYRPENISEQKIKKTSGSDEMIIHMVQNPDIVATVASKADRPFVVGFAAETNDVIDYAKSKLKKKNLDMIVANDVSRDDIGFNSDQNEVHIITNSSIKHVPQMDKKSLAESIVSNIASEMGLK